ncbi:ABC transporter ATP-binding protein [Cryobacterium sp. TMS1-20-1]|uniref:ABC transporter ATP-binding protein n=1 Tax=Cryobacterium sp. TMS1-20-1 TaxID=1259223 RepID=UPI00106CEC60|nr:ABC transporter ATP-binding protein [Cryobacterium sp. TMS1-20-1]TFC78893.1 ABC transporter ATP-binding protein [Cryobacterium sp. TMS1-20-1]
MLELKNARIGYGPVSVVHNLTISVGASEAVFLVGPNGAGKSTTLRGIIGHNPLTSGSITWEGKDIGRLAPHQRARLGIALVPEGRHVFPQLSVLENLEVAARLGPSTRVKERIEGIFDRFPRLAGRRSQKAGLLSGGEQQMLAIGRALVQEPRLLVIDELSLGLAPVIYQQLGESVRGLARDGLSVLLVEQNAVLAMKICSRGYLLSGGTVVLEGTVEELKTKSEMRELYLGGLGKGN